MILPLLAMIALPATAPLADAPDVLEEVRVEDLPGPMMWRISREDHELWIIGTISPTPLDLAWNRKEVEAVVREADEIIGGVDVAAGLNLRSGFALLGRNSTVATMPIRVLAGPDGVLEQLRRSGYTVEAPH